MITTSANFGCIDNINSDTNRTLAAISLAGYDITASVQNDDSVSILRQLFEDIGVDIPDFNMTQLGVSGIILKDTHDNRKVVIIEQYYNIFDSLMVITTGSTHDDIYVRSYNVDRTFYYSNDSFHDTLPHETPVEFIRRFIGE
jgi:hypothetical protein